jgi:hypothetical protein
VLKKKKRSLKGEEVKEQGRVKEVLRLKKVKKRC